MPDNMRNSTLGVCLVLLSSPVLGAGQPSAQAERMGEAVRDYTRFTTEAAIIQELSRATQAGGDPNARNARGLTPLHFACDRSLPKVIEWLVEHGADVNLADPGGTSPLFIGVPKLPLSTVQFLVEHGAKVGAKTPEGYSVLWKALRSHRYDLAAYLVEKGAPLEGRKKLFLYAQIGHLPGVRKEWRKGVSHKAKDAEGQTLLHLAAFHGHRDLAELLLDRKADANARDAKGHTPLWFAITSEDNPKGKVALLDLLVRRGADPRVRFEEEQTLLHVAARVGTNRLDSKLFVEPIRWLIQRGVPVDARDKHGRSAAYHAAKARNYPIARVLVEAAPELDRDELGAIALASVDNEGLLHWLIEARKANINARDEWGKTLLHMAARMGRVRLARYLLDHGADPSVKDGAGDRWLDDSMSDEFRAEFAKPAR